MRRRIHTISHLRNAGNESNEDMISSSLDAIEQTQFYEQTELLFSICNTVYSLQLMARR